LRCGTVQDILFIWLQAIAFAFARGFKVMCVEMRDRRAAPVFHISQKLAYHFIGIKILYVQASKELLGINKSLARTLI
jgi:hypothetical protein